MFENLVAGTDGTRRAAAVLEQAAALARSSGLTIHLVHAYNPSAGALRDPRRPALELLDREAAQLRAEGIAVRTYAVPGNAVDALIEVAETEHARLIVVGSRGMSGPRRFAGSVPDKVSHLAPCSVLIVRGRSR